MEPMISCLMVTQPGREALVQCAVNCWRRQSYRRRELIVVCDDPHDFVDTIRTEVPEAVVVITSPGQTLGELRNKSVAAASGEILCQWDDDDQYHPERLTSQLKWMDSQRADACFLATQLHYFADRRELYVRDTGSRGIEGTVMHRRGLEVSYPALGKSEDSYYMQSLRRQYRATVLQGFPWLYLRVFHGRNTWDESHHRRMMRGALGRRSLEAIRPDLARHLGHYRIARPVAICGQDGKAFTL